MSVMGPLLVHKKSSASTMFLLLSFTSNPPSTFGGKRNLVPLVSTHGSVWAGALKDASDKSANASMTLENGILPKIEDFILPFLKPNPVFSIDFKLDLPTPSQGRSCFTAEIRFVRTPHSSTRASAPSGGKALA